MANLSPPRLTQRLCRLIAPEGVGGIPDPELLERFVSRRDEAAFELLVRRHERLVLGVCRRVLHDRHDAEDAFQAAFLVLARKAGAIGRRTSLAAWLCRVAFRCALRAERTARHHAGLAPLDFDVPAAAADQPDSAAAWRELRPLLDREIDRLPEKYRVPVVLCYLEGKTYAEAARDLGCPVGTVSTRLAKARELLRRRLARPGLGLTAGLLAAVLAEQSAVASVPAVLVRESVQAALGRTAPVGVVPARVAALAQGVLRTMLWTRMKIVAIVVLTAGLVGTGAGVALQPGTGAEPAPAEQAPPPPAPEKETRTPPRPEPAQAPLDRCLAGWEKAFADTDTLVADVSRVECRNTSLLKKTFVGTFKYRKPDSFLVEMHNKDGPDDFEKWVWHGRVLHQYLPGRKEVQVIDWPPRAPEGLPESWAGLLRTVFAWRSVLCVEPGGSRQCYDFKLVKEDAYYVYLGLTPRTDELKKSYRRGRLVLSLDSFLPRQLWLERPNGDTVTWDASRIERNVRLPEDEFANPPVPRGWKLIRLPSEPSRR